MMSGIQKPVTDPKENSFTICHFYVLVITSQIAFKRHDPIQPAWMDKL